MIAIIFILGAVIGSFIGLCADRLPRRQSIVSPPSHCPQCKKQLRITDLAPIVSWFLQKGRCRYCDGKISIRYVALECAVGLLFVFAYWDVGWQIELLRAWFFLSFLLLVACIDLVCGLILRKVMLAMVLTEALLCLILPGALFDISALEKVMSALLGGGVLWMILWMSGGGMGYGDVYFGAVLGFWLGWQQLLLTLFLAFFFGGCIGMLLMLFGKKRRTDAVPFAPFLSFGAALAYFYAVAFMEGYRWLFM